MEKVEWVKIPQLELSQCPHSKEKTPAAGFTMRALVLLANDRSVWIMCGTRSRGHLDTDVLTFSIVIVLS